jgi:integrase
MIKIGMRIYKRKNGNWYIAIDRKKRYSLHTKDKKEAQYLLKQAQRKALAGKLFLFDQNKKIELKDFAKEYLGWLEKSSAETTYKRAELVLRTFIAYVGNLYLSAVTQRKIEQYLQERINTIKPTTINIEVRHLKAVFNKAVEWECLKSNPFKHIKQLRIERPLPKFLTEEEIGKMLKIIANERDKLLFIIYIYTGMRRSEAINLRWEDVNLKDKTIYIKNTKTKIPRIIPIQNKLYKLLLSYKKNIGKLFNVSPNTITHRFKKYFRAIGKGNFRVHDLRHTFASQLVMYGADLPTVQALLGHTSITTTMIYTHLSVDHMRKIIDHAFGENTNRNAHKKHTTHLELVKK